MAKEFRNRIAARPQVGSLRCGAVDVRARQITEEMKQAAAHAIAGCIAPRQLSPEYIVPSVFNREVVQRVADAVRRAAIKAGVARKRK